MTEKYSQVSSSFRDPSGFIFLADGVIYRQVNRRYEENYNRLIDSGLYDKLVSEGLLLSHIEVDIKHAVTEDAYKIIKPFQFPFISYPYEWCFSQLKQAALLTLKIQSIALDFGMSLKDSSAYNIQYRQGTPIFIDTLSFEEYQAGKPWVAYRQFCQHFLAPLALMSYTDIRLQQLLRIYIDGIPLDLASALLTARSWINFGLLSHIHLHARFQRRYADKSVSSSNRRNVSRTAFLGLIDNLKSTVQKLTWQPRGTEWHNYYDISNYDSAALENKRQIVTEMLGQITPVPKSAWDFGANVGLFSRIASDQGIQTVAFDIDPAAVEKNYLESVKRSEINILPLVLDLTNPSPGLGWENQERETVFERGPTDVILSLALIHHLAISNNLPFDKVAHVFIRVCTSLIIEFVPKNDTQVQKLLLNREDIFDDYNQQVFENEFSQFFTIRSKSIIPDTSRVLYLMQK